MPVRPLSALQRWYRFNLVGVAGFVLQLTLLHALSRLTSWPVPVCVAVAVLLTVSHNFAWHTRYTWPARARRGGSGAARGGRLLQWFAFNGSNGLVSLICNVLATPLLVAHGVPLLVANVLGIAVASLANFVVSDRLVFAHAPSTRRAAGARRCGDAITPAT